ncbi:hypothetical protein BHU72_00555 [Desulfuribacillus stibiiarsenatis]|uniref:PDZ domain-containing protein n=1 Tax=Desulfuribacillus stibiiarsenatis TaxID=1390249 RepID=A0A1E5L9G6_9FIRM|nr:S41 family peptidase [Desulfuribacillus stibiiarsenatis]OEH86795.1 hypothetical protein BHU72_00555 [Desulfuribacillus stibiiarsenatis]
MKLQIRKLLLLTMVCVALGASFYYVYDQQGASDFPPSSHAERVATTEDLTNYPKDFEKLLKAYREIDQRYIEDVPTQKLIDGAIRGMLEALDDPYTSYMNPEAAQEFDHSIQSSFEGIGAEVASEAGKVKIVSPIKGSPAERAGLLPGDLVFTVNGETVEGLTLMEAILKIRGPKGSKVVLQVQREGHRELISVEIIRDTIPIETVHAEMIEGTIGKIEITQFSLKTADRFAAELKNLKQQGMKGLIIDVRNNPGGVLETVVKICSQFIPNQGIVLQIENHKGEREVVRSTLKQSDFPVVVLMDKGSASASEILAAAAQESAGFKVVGVNSFGKGSVQTTEKFSDGSEMKFTIAKWLTPKGNWINKVGVTPDIEVQLPEVFTTGRIPSDVTLKYDDNSTNVRSLQIFLRHLGFPTDRVDGYFSRQTEKALTDFQQSKGLPMDGVVSEKVAQALNQAVVDSLKASDTQLAKAIEVLKQQMK